MSAARHLVFVALIATAAPAQGAELLGELAFRVRPEARVVSDAKPRDGRFGLSISGDSAGLTAQLSQVPHPMIATWAVVPRAVDAEWIELRLHPSVRGVIVSRPEPGRLVLGFTDSPFAADASVFRAERARAAEAGPRTEQPDTVLTELLRAPMLQAATAVEVDGFRWPVGTRSPMRLPPRVEVPPLPFGSVPPMVRGAWRANPSFAEAIAQADLGNVKEAAALLRAARVTSDPERALLSLARAHVYSRPRSDGEPTHGDWAAEAYRGAAALYPDAQWAPWARGQAAYTLWREGRHADASVQAKLAAAAAPQHPDRAWWEVVAGHSLVQQGRIDAGLERLAAHIDGLPDLDRSARYAARRAVATALWAADDPVRAARVLDLLAADHPARAAHPREDRDFARIYLDAGRTDGARPRLERMRTQAEQKVDRERARWWLHEVALEEGDGASARELLHELLRSHPGSVLAPAARVRLSVLDALARTNRYAPEGDMIPPSWGRLAVQLRRVALQWPHTFIEDEALSLVGQIWFRDDMIDDALDLYAWLEARTPGVGGPTDRFNLVCDRAPALVSSLFARGEPVRALGRFRRHLDTDEFGPCISPELEDTLVQAAIDADLPGIAIARLGRAVTRGADAERLGEQLVQLAAIQRAEGRLRVAERTLDFVRERELPVDGGREELARADLDVAAGRPAEALQGYARAAAKGAAEGEVLAGRSRALEDQGKFDEAARLAARSLAAGEVDDPTGEYLRLADLKRRTSRTRADWEGVLSALEAGELEGRTADWIRTDALLALDRPDELEPVLARLATESDAFGHWARELTSAADFERKLDSMIAGEPVEASEP